MNRRRSSQRPPREPFDPDASSIDDWSWSRYGPSRVNRYIDRVQRRPSSALRMWTAARSAPPPFSDGSTKQMRSGSDIADCGLRIADWLRIDGLRIAHHDDAETGREVAHHPLRQRFERVSARRR